MPAISIQLLKTLNSGVQKLSIPAIVQLKDFVNSQLTSEGSFIGKNGKPDLYYSAFGYLLSYVLGIKLSSKKIFDYLDSQSEYDGDLIHHAAYIRSRILANALSRNNIRFIISYFKGFKIPDLNKFDQLPHGSMEGPYTQFIWYMLRQDARATIYNKEEIKNQLNQFTSVGGGFANQKNADASCNATAAALNVLGQIDGYKPNLHTKALANMQEEYGGFKASKDSPVADILSTATALFTLHCYGITPKYKSLQFVESHWLDAGGFAPTLFESQSDVEYCFYGLLALGASVK